MQMLDLQRVRSDGWWEAQIATADMNSGELCGESRGLLYIHSRKSRGLDSNSVSSHQRWGEDTDSEAILEHNRYDINVPGNPARWTRCHAEPMSPQPTKSLMRH